MIETMPTIGSKFFRVCYHFYIGGELREFTRGSTYAIVCLGVQEIKRKGTQNYILNHQPEESAKEVIGFYLGFLWYTPED